MGKEQELVQCIRSNDVESFRKIIAKFKQKSKKGQKKASFHIVDHDGFIPLHHAALSGSGEIVMALLEFSTDVNAKDKKELPDFYMCQKHCLTYFMKWMTPLHLAAWAGKVEPTLLLLDAGAETNLCARSGATPLHLASEHGNYGVVERLVDHDCDPTVVNNLGETALDLACRFGHLEVVRILLNNSRGKCEKLLNPKEFQEKSSPLHMAAKTGHFDVVKLLVEAGADINQRGPTGSCLHEAALYGKTDVVKYLVEAGIDVNIKNREGQTALEMVTQFTKAGASSDIKHVLREASLEVVYAKAIKDYANVTDDSFLTLRLGDIVLVLDRSKDGMWKGCVRDEHKERIGFFPSSAVKVLRSPPRNSVKRSSSSSSEASKVSTIGTVSNTFEIVTVAPPSQPVANKSNLPKMSSFRKKAPKRTQYESDRTAKVAETRRNNSDSAQSESDVNEKNNKLTYLDILVVENTNNKSAPLSTKTEYADLRLPRSNGESTTHGKTGLTTTVNKKTDAEIKDVAARTNESQKSVRVSGSYVRLGRQVLGNQGSGESEKLRQELQKQQEERLKRQQRRMEEHSSRCADDAEKQKLGELGKQEFPERQLLQHEKEQKNHLKQELQQQQQQQKEPKQQLHDTQIQEPCRSLSEDNVVHSHSDATVAKKSRHYTMSSLVANSEDLLPLPLKKRHSFSSGKPSIPVVTDPSLPSKPDKKHRSSFRVERRTTSPPPPPPPPPSASNTTSPVPRDNLPDSTRRSPSPTLPPLPKPMELSPISPTLLKTAGQFPPAFAKHPIPAPSHVESPRTKVSPTPLSNQPARSFSPSFPPPPPSISDDADSAGATHADVFNNKLSVKPQVERSPSPPLPPPPEGLGSLSVSPFSDFPPPPQMLLENSPNEDNATSCQSNFDKPDEEPSPALLYPRPDTLEMIRTTSQAAFRPPSPSTLSRDGYEDMTRLKRTWTKPETAIDQKGYVMINPVRRPNSPTTHSANTVAASSPASVSSQFYENFIPLRTRNFEVRKLPQGQNHLGETSPTKSVERKPEKPTRHAYENYDITRQILLTTESREVEETPKPIKDSSSEKSTSGALPVLRVPPVPQVPSEAPSDETNSRTREYGELFDWLSQSKLLAYMDDFAAAEFDLAAVAELTADDLSEMKITKTGHRKRLLSEAAKLSKPVFTYENNVPSWLMSLGLSRYENNFIDGGFDDMEFLYDLTKDDLEAIGITKIGHQRKILMAAKKLQERGTISPEPVV